MIPVPIDLPLKTNEAAELAELVFEHAGGRKLNESVRNSFSSFTPLLGSLQRDPIHPSTYYVAVDTALPTANLLLRIALAASPSSGIFPGALLIGRMRTRSGREVVVNAIPFSSLDHGNIRKFAEEVDRDFLPRPLGAASTIEIGSVPDFEACRSLTKHCGVAVVGPLWYETVWAAIRAGWRRRWAAVGPEGTISGDFTRYCIRATPKTIDTALKLYAAIQEARVGSRFDCELDLRGTEEETTSEDIAACLKSFRSAGYPVHSIAPRLAIEPRSTLAARLAALQAAARKLGALLSLDLVPESGVLALVGKVTAGKVNYRGSSSDILQLAKELRL